MRVAGKRALVTGATQGIGAGIAHALAEQGARVVVSGIDSTAGSTVVQAIRDAGGDATYHPLDVTDEQQWEAAFGWMEQQWGGVDVLVNNAGISMFGPVTELTLEQWRRCIAVDLDGVFLGTKHAVRLMRCGGGGSIVNISSIGGITGVRNLSAYAAAKGGVRLFTKAVAMECAAEGIRVNSIHPGMIVTPIFDDVSVGADGGRTVPKAEGGASVDLSASAKAIVPLGRPGKPSDVAAAVLYLASDESGYVTGTEMIVDGGLTAGTGAPRSRS